VNDDEFALAPKTPDVAETSVPAPVNAPLENRHKLTPRALLFAHAYCGVAEFNAYKAYQIAGGKARGPSGRTNASRMLTDDRVQAEIRDILSARVERLAIMDGDEALGRLTKIARGGDIRKLFPNDSDIARWPDEIVDLVKSVTRTKHGLRVEWHDKLRALELMAKSGGKLKETVKVETSLEDIVTGMPRHAGQSSAAPAPLGTRATTETENTE
jgi:hypothetical protein